MCSEIIGHSSKRFSMVRYSIMSSFTSRILQNFAYFNGTSPLVISDTDSMVINVCRCLDNCSIAAQEATKICYLSSRIVVH